MPRSKPVMDLNLKKSQQKYALISLDFYHFSYCYRELRCKEKSQCRCRLITYHREG